MGGPLIVHQSSVLQAEQAVRSCRKRLLVVLKYSGKAVQMMEPSAINLCLQQDDGVGFVDMMLILGSGHGGRRLVQGTIGVSVATGATNTEKAGAA